MQTLPRDLLTLVSPAVARAHRLIPLSIKNGALEIGIAEQPAASLLRDLAFWTGRRIVLTLLPDEEIDGLLQLHYGDVSPPRLHALPRPGAGPLPGGSVVRQVDEILHQAIGLGASDIHFEPYEGVFRVRYRLDGVLHTAHELLPAQQDEILARLKVMAALDIAEKRRPQDGSLRVGRDAGPVDLRVSTLPTGFGEKIVLRLLDRQAQRLDLGAVGFDAAHLAAFKKAIQLPYGMILVTGPTGSGKTTTLYAALAALNQDTRNVLTVEDPIECGLPGINQTQVRPDIGFTFAHALRAFLRQDPDVIMVGEIRDAETAEIAIRAALTGHLVLSTLHTNDAPATITRLIDMGIEPFLVASSVRLVVAQRLVRRICPDCSDAVDVAPALRSDLPLEEVPPRCLRGRGCPACRGTGYRGRTAVFQVLPITEALASLIARRASVYELRRQAEQEGMRSLRSSALQQVRSGVTTPEEALRVTAA